MSLLCYIHAWSTLLQWFVHPLHAGWVHCRSNLHLWKWQAHESSSSSTIHLISEPPLHIQSSIASSKLSLLLRFQICNKTSLTEELFVFTRCRYQTGRVSGHIKPKRAKPTKPHCPYPASFGGSQHPTDGHNPSWSSARGEILASRHFSMLPTHRCKELSDFPWIFPPACNIMSSPSTLDFAKSPLTLPPFFCQMKNVQHLNPLPG